MMDARLDVITIGRCSIDLYGQQIGSRLEDVTSFAKSVGGCPANIAIGTARLGLKSGLVTRVGDEQMGRFVKEQMAREGVALDGITTDPDRLTALVLLSVVDDKTFPLIFYRENCADWALCEADVEESFIASARAILVTGTHFSRANTDAAQRKAMGIAKRAGRRIAFDIDYRPNLWGLAGHAAGEERYIRSERVSAHLRAVLPECDLIVGTEEEIHIAAGVEDTLEALRLIRDCSAATIVLKRGPMGCVVFPDRIPGRIEDGIVGRGFPIEVYNVLGAGDAFLSGFLRGWLRGEPHETSATWANACGAFAVSRLLCSPESPTWPELQHFLAHGSSERALRKDETLNHLHWATTRRSQPDRLLLFDFAGEAQPIAPARSDERVRQGITVLAKAAAGRPGMGVGVILDEGAGTAALYEAARHGLWIGRLLPPPEEIANRLVEWPVGHTAICRPQGQPGHDRPEQLQAVHRTVRAFGRELVIAVSQAGAGASPLSAGLRDLYARRIRPDWWVIETESGAEETRALAALIAEEDPWCRGILLACSPGAGDDRWRRLEAAAAAPAVKGCILEAGAFAAPGEPWSEEPFARALALWEAARERRAA